MTDPDFFAKIARVTHPLDQSSLSARQPLPFPQRFFQPSQQQAEEVRELTQDENLARFQSGLADLKLRYRPFLEKHTPPPALQRPALELKEFDFRFETEADRDFASVLAGAGDWERVTIPDYRGPVGKWTGFYRRTFSYPRPANPDQHVFLRFAGVDYIAKVTLNNRFVGAHEGFFAPFEFDVTPFLEWDKENVLLVEVQNDIPTIGIEDWGIPEDGDKIYAATGPGWDDPLVGWHHCPPGAGIYQRVVLEERAPLFVHSLFVRPDIDGGKIEAWVEVYNSLKTNQAFHLNLSVHPRNFEAGSLAEIPCRVNPAGPGLNTYRLVLPLPNFRLWSPDEPWLYDLRAALSWDDQLQDQKDCTFGMRKFHMDESAQPKGALFLNNQPIFLRGANEMGHLQQCVMRGDDEQLIEDILIAKLANMNYYRITQRPVQDEIYSAFDCLGMLQQCDLPLFGYLRRNQWNEAVRQSGEMERLIRSHPSSIMVSFINEPFPIGRQDEEVAFVSYDDKGHRHLYRDELEAFFVAARKAIYVENPDRVVKNVEGDYNPPTAEGLSDFHCYPLWYTNHAIPIGKLYRGYLPAIKNGWRTGCGEYGTEGLDNYQLMRARYPQGWLPEQDDLPWNPDKIVRSQTFSMHGDWFEEQNRIQDWIRASQRHQAFATQFITDALRRRADLVVSTAIHLLIDAWPSGWMKTLVGVDRLPKPSYFAFQKSLEPLRVHLRCDRWKAYSAETLAVEAWVLNDTPADLPGCTLVATIRDAQTIYGSFELALDVPAVQATQAGLISFSVPGVADRGVFYVDATLLDGQGHPINSERLCLEAFAPLPTAAQAATQGEGSVLFCPAADFLRNQADFASRAAAGARVIVQLDTPGQFDFNGLKINVKEMNGIFFLGRDPSDILTRDFQADDFSFWYNQDKDYLDFLSSHYLECDELSPLLFSYQKPGFTEFARGWKRKLPVVAKMAWGKGELIFSALALAGRLGCNPILDRFLQKALAPAAGPG